MKEYHYVITFRFFDGQQTTSRGLVECGESTKFKTRYDVYEHLFNKFSENGYVTCLFFSLEPNKLN